MKFVFSLWIKKEDVTLFVSRYSFSSQKNVAKHFCYIEASALEKNQTNDFSEMFVYLDSQERGRKTQILRPLQAGYLPSTMVHRESRNRARSRRKGRAKLILGNLPPSSLRSLILLNTLTKMQLASQPVISLGQAQKDSLLYTNSNVFPSSFSDSLARIEVPFIIIDSIAKIRTASTTTLAPALVHQNMYINWRPIRSLACSIAFPLSVEIE